jgi:hypothetical protein
MYLSGPMTFRFPDGHTEVLNPGAPMTWLADFLRRQGTAIRSDGSAMTRGQILGGELFDSCPANVILNEAWLPEQLDAINTNPAVKAAVQSCRYFPAPPPGTPTPQLPANNAPGATSTGEALTRAGAGSGAFGPQPGGLLVPTGVVTPTVITVPGGGGYIPEPATPAPAPTSEMTAGGGLLPMLLLGGAAVWFFTRKKKGA